MAPGAVVYLRVSSEEQLSNLSLATQEKACREYCTRHGLKVLAVFRDEGVSAKTAARAELQELILFVEVHRRDVSAVVVYQLSRFARNQFDHFALRLRLQRAGVGLRSVTEPVDDTPTGRLLEGVMAAVAEFDNQAKAARTVAGMREAIARGRWPWVAPVGYRHRPRNPDGSPGGLEVDEALADLVRRAFERVAGGATIEEARRDVTAAGLRAASGRPLSRQTFHRMLRNRLYSGRIVAPGWEIEATSAAPIIVEEGLILRVQRALERRRPARYLTATSSEFPLRGLVYCECGRKLSAYSARGRGGKLYRHFRCPVCAVNVSLDALDRAFERLLGQLAAPPEVVDLFEEIFCGLMVRHGEARKLAISAAQSRVASSADRLANLIRLRAHGEISAEELALVRPALVRERDEATLELANLSGVDALAARRALSTWARRLLTNPAGIWRELSGDQRATLAPRLFPAGIQYAAGETSNRGKSLLDLPFRPTSEPAVAGGTPDGIRTRVCALKGRCPRPG